MNNYSFDMSPGEARDKAIVLLRKLWDAGHRNELRDFQKNLKVQQFKDVPVESGYKFYQAVAVLAESLATQR